MSRFELRLASQSDAKEVEAFNQRMERAGSYHRLTLSRPYSKIALHSDSRITLEQYFCFLDDHIRGGVAVKQMPFLLHALKGREVAAISYPLSEGIIDRTFSMVGLAILRSITRQYPLTYALGVGSLEEPVARLMVGAGWHSLSVPFHFAVLRAGPFLRNFSFLRKRGGFRLLLDLLAATGLGVVGLEAFKLFQRLRGRYPNTRDLGVERFDKWEDWADDIWEAAHDHYTCIGDRSASTLRALYPAGHEHMLKVRVKVTQDKTVGWAVFSASRVNKHRYFGNMVLGTLIDMLALPGGEQRVVNGALSAMSQAGADVIVVNHSAANWNKAFRQAGLLPFRSNFFLFLSPELGRHFEPIVAFADGFYFTRGDGDGPVNLWSRT